MALLARAVEAATGSEPIRVVLPSPSDVPVVRVIAPGLKLDTYIRGAQ
jgi:ribosomal protein S12 methylthiotransferase accessory factor YcaO